MSDSLKPSLTVGLLPNSGPILFSALRLAPCDLVGERAQVPDPESTKLGDPGIDLLERLRIHRIDSSWPFDSDLDEA